MKLPAIENSGAWEQRCACIVMQYHGAQGSAKKHALGKRNLFSLAVD
jgi:hypothetical protein